MNLKMILAGCLSLSMLIEMCFSVSAKQVDAKEKIITSPTFTRATYTKDNGPYYKTNKSIIKAFQLLGSVCGLINAYIHHPVLGGISALFATTATIADGAYVTMYIKFYQVMNTYDYNECRETQYWYGNGQYTGNSTKRTIYFLTRNPT